MHAGQEPFRYSFGSFSLLFDQLLTYDNLVLGTPKFIQLLELNKDFQKKMSNGTTGGGCGIRISAKNKLN